MHDQLEKVAAGEKVSEVSLTTEDVPNDRAFLVSMRERRKLKGNGPRGLVAIGDKIYATEYFTDSLAVVNIDPDSKLEAKSIPLGRDVRMTAVRKGEMFFHDASLCFQNWQSCNSCHPADARSDALNWDLLNDGMGNPKNTRSLLLSHKTPPAMISGIRPDAETAVRAGIRFIQFAVRPEEDAVAIDEFLKSLKPIPSPYLVKGKLSKSAKRGKKVFKKAQCGMCHSGPLFTDLTKYNMDTGKGLDKGQAFDTPTLIEVWRTAPYLHDGRSATIIDVLITHNPADRHGMTSDLSRNEIEDLAEFVLSQ